PLADIGGGQTAQPDCVEGKRWRQLASPARSQNVDDSVASTGLPVCVLLRLRKQEAGTGKSRTWPALAHFLHCVPFGCGISREVVIDDKPNVARPSLTRKRQLSSRQ